MHTLRGPDRITSVSDTVSGMPWASVRTWCLPADGLDQELLAALLRPSQGGAFGPLENSSVRVDSALRPRVRLRVGQTTGIRRAETRRGMNDGSQVWLLLPSSCPTTSPRPLKGLLEEVAEASPGQQVTENMVNNAKRARKGLLGGSILPGLVYRRGRRHVQRVPASLELRLCQTVKGPDRVSAAGPALPRRQVHGPGPRAWHAGVPGRACWCLSSRGEPCAGRRRRVCGRRWRRGCRAGCPGGGSRGPCPPPGRR